MPRSSEPGDKPFVLAGGFKSGSRFAVRDSAAHVSKAFGNGGSFIRIEDPAPTGDALVAIDGFEITGYSQAIVRDFWESQGFEITNNHIHGNECSDQSLAGAGFALLNVSGAIRGNVIRDNACGRGGAGFLNDSLDQNRVVIEGNRIEGNSGTEPSAHGGGLYLFGNALEISDNLFVDNTVTQWGGGLFVGAYTPGGQHTTATLTGNVFRANRAGHSGGGFFCDDGATCLASHELYDRNCGGNILLDGGSEGSGPTTSRFDHITNVGALDPECKAPGLGVLIGNYEMVAPDSHVFADAIFWGNAPGGDFATACTARCEKMTVTVERSLVDTRYQDQSIRIDFGAGIVASTDPQFLAPERGDFRLRPGSPATGLGALVEAEAEAAPESQEPVAEADSELEPAPEPAASSGTPPPAVTRNASFMGFPEAFNRYYTDPGWTPTRTVYVSPDGGGDGATRESPMTPRDAIAVARAGTLIHFLAGNYPKAASSSPRKQAAPTTTPSCCMASAAADGSPAVVIDCSTGTRQACVNLEGADYVAIDGFEFVNGRYGVRSVGLGYKASEHARGVAVLNSIGHGQGFDPFFSGQSDWAVWEGNVAYDAGEGDGHGFYISNGGDWNIVRRNETYANQSSDFQINADPGSTCGEEGIAFDDPQCDAYAGEGEGGQGASDYFLVEANHFHDGLGPGANFTSVRRSLIRNNIFGPQARHNVSFWQETDNPKLGSSDNKILHNLFITTGRHAVQLTEQSTRNVFANNLLIGIQREGDAVTANANALLMEVDASVSANTYRGNFYVSGRIEGRDPSPEEVVRTDFSPTWFRRFPTVVRHDPSDFAPTSEAPFLEMGELLPDALADRSGVARQGRVAIGPIEAP